MKKVVISIIVIFSILGIILGIILYSNYQDRQSDAKAKSDKESIEQYRKDVLEKSGKEYRENQARCADYLAKGGSELDKDYKLNCTTQPME